MPRFNPPLPIVTDQVFKLVLRGSLLGQTVINTFFLRSDFLTNPLFTDPAASWWAQCQVTLRALSVPALEYDSIRQYLLNDPAFAPLDFTIPDAERQGTFADSEPNTSFLAVGYRRQTIVAGQRGRGAFRIAGVPEDATFENGYLAGYITKIEAFMNAVDQTVPSLSNPGETYTPVLASVSITPPDTAVVRASEIVDRVSYQRVPSTQRTRRPRTSTGA